MNREDLIYMIRDGATIPQTHAIIDHIDQLEQENQQLKEEINEYKRLGYKHLQEKNNKLENILDEIREYIDKFPCIHYASAEKVEGKRLSGKLIPIDDLLQILDKVKE